MAIGIKIIESPLWLDLAGFLRYDSFKHVGVRAGDKSIIIYHYGLMVAGITYSEDEGDISGTIERVKNMIIDSVFPIDIKAFEDQENGESFRSTPEYLDRKRKYKNDKL